jgi:hypothetical protein
MRRWLLVPLALVAVLVPSAAGSRLADSLAGAAEPTPTGVKITIANNGTTVLTFDRGTLPANQTATSATQNGQPCRVDGSNFGCGPFTLAPGQTAIILVEVPGGFHGGGTIPMEATSDGVNDSGPFQIPVVCHCESISLKVTREALNFTDDLRFHFQLVWTMTCAGAAGKCKGQIKMDSPDGLTFTLPKTATISCSGTCAKKSTQPVFAGGPWPKPLRNLKGRRNKTITISFHKFCLVNGGMVDVGTDEMTVVYNAKGIVDQKHSFKITKA